MKISEIVNKLNLKVLSGENCLETEVKGCYIGDLLSVAMSKLKRKNVWVTVQTNINVAAVSVLTEIACVIIADGFEPDDVTLKKAREEELIILGSDKTTYELAAKLFDIGI